LSTALNLIPVELYSRLNMQNMRWLL